MKYRVLGIENSIGCSVVERLNRFVVEVQLRADCRKAYINNTGRLHQFLVKGREGFCVQNDKPGKTDYRLFAIKEGNLAAIIDTQLQMKALERSLEMRLIPWLEGYRVSKRNARLGESVIDYLLECSGKPVYLEVKSAVLREGHYAMYPDCSSARGRRHIRELTSHVDGGGRATILFIAALPEVKAFKPCRSADPELCELLVEAHQAGVEIRSIGMFYQPEDSFIYLFHPDLAVYLS